MTTLARAGRMAGPRALEPVETTLAAMRARLGDSATQGLHRDIIVDALAGWVPATRLVDGSRVPHLIDMAKQRWGAQPHAAAALAWKSYTYWLALPAVVGYTSARRVPLVYPEHVLVDLHGHQPFLTVGLRRPTVAVLPSDPLATLAPRAVRVVRDQPELLHLLRESLLDAHLEPVLRRIRERVNIGRRTLLGSVASGIAYGIVRAQAHAAPHVTIRTVTEVLAALDLADLVDLSPAPGGGVRVLRRTCCLAFTLPEPKICSGCVLRA